MRIAIRTIPRAGRSAIDGVHNGALRVRVAAAPVDGAANDEAISVLSDAFDVPRSSIEIVKGNHSRNKVVAIRGITREVLEERIATALGD